MAKRQDRITLEDVANAAGVTPMTVSRVINNKGRVSEATRQRILQIAEELGYRPNRAARALVTNRTQLVAFVVPDITNPYFSAIFQGVDDVLGEAGYNVLVANTNETPYREQVVLGQLENGTVDGLISCSSRLADDVLFPLLQRYPAVVSITRAVPRDLGSAVLSEYKHGFRSVIALQYLHDLGRRHIGAIGLTHYERFVNMDEFWQAIRQRGLHLPPERYVTCPPTWQAGYEAGRKLLTAQPDLDAIAAGNDLIALGVMRAAAELGRRIPDDLAVIGADDILLASQVTPALTTYRIDSHAIGMMAAELLLPRMGGDTTYRERRYQTELIIRDTT